MSMEHDGDRLVAGGEICKKFTPPNDKQGKELGQEVVRWIGCKQLDYNKSSLNVRYASQPQMPPLPLPTLQEKLQKCLEPLEQKLQEITRCKSSEEKKPGELKVKAGDPIWQAINQTLTTHYLIQF